MTPARPRTILPVMSRHSPRHELDNWLDSHGYQHAHARKQKTPHPYAVSPRMNHARKLSQAGAYAASGRQLLKDLATLSVRARQEADTTLLELVTRASKGDPGALIELRPALAALRAGTTHKDHATRKGVSNKDPAVMTAGSINKELDKLEEQNSKLGQMMIDTGRGHERPSEYLNMSDPLALELQQNYDRRNKLRAEIERRYGPGAPRRLPPGRFFGPLKSSHATRKQQGPKYSPSDAVRTVLRRRLSTYDTPTEIKLNMSLLRNALSKCVPGNEILVDTLTDKIRELSMGLARMPNPARTRNHAAKAGVGRTKPVTIVVAWTEDTQELAPGQKAWRHDLGERPKLVDVKKPHAAVWANRGTPTDVTKACEYSRKTNPGTGLVMVYPTTEKDPLGRARKDILEGRGSP